MRNKYFSFSTGNVLFNFEDFQFCDFPAVTIDSDMFMMHGNGSAWQLEFRESDAINFTCRKGKFDLGEICDELYSLTFNELRVIAAELPKREFKRQLVCPVRIGSKKVLVDDLALLIQRLLIKLVEIDAEMRKFEKWNYTKKVECAVRDFIFVG
ncbi:hypothetical protein LEHPIFIF_00264 [Aeromonas phage avDM9-HANS]|nr:hypothetical protein LEHPIFIF_00264 [Aeromonas phage avDM9-HANS]